MFGIKELKQNIAVDDTQVECPVQGCKVRVERQKRIFQKEDRFKCPMHNIYISPTTFEYEEEVDNILWRSGNDLKLLDEIYKSKRESRISRDNSEDAVTWNVFRFLDRNALLGDILSRITGFGLEVMDIVYWSYSISEKNVWSELKKARIEFGESESKGSEPDIIIITDKALFFIEAKLTARNETIPKNSNVQEGYLKGGGGWFSEICKESFDNIAVKDKKYELLRFWLLGTWIANQMNLKFYLVNLVLSDRERDIESRFTKNICENQSMMFKRYTWEEIYKVIAENNYHGPDKQVIMEYFRNKAIGYDSKGKIQKAFSI